MKALSRLLVLALCFYVQGGLGIAASAEPANVPSNDYLNALQAADGFAWAWAHRDPGSGARALAQSLRTKLGKAAMAAYFQGTSSPQHWAFEVGPGTLVQAGTYRFAVRLYSYLSSGGGFTQSATAGRLTVSKDAGGRWYVTGLP